MVDGRLPMIAVEEDGVNEHTGPYIMFRISYSLSLVRHATTNVLPISDPVRRLPNACLYSHDIISVHTCSSARIVQSLSRRDVK
jgi:hypothetical protein